MKRRTIFFWLAIFSVGAWLILNPIGYFGLHSFGFTVYNALPLPVVDVQIRADGAMRTVSKTHDLALENVRWLLVDNPTNLIVSTGWQNVLKPRRELAEVSTTAVEFLTTDKAIRRFNELKNAGERVAIHVHSTC